MSRANAPFTISEEKRYKERNEHGQAFMFGDSIGERVRLLGLTAPPFAAGVGIDCEQIHGSRDKSQ